mmetsp:Transcript_1497/g.9172  ORF Transcript_1497/g.9172 Transcript_1497/m.9172 type:complete len:92 (+) Transcript_1497:2979-3254(+)
MRGCEPSWHSPVFPIDSEASAGLALCAGGNHSEHIQWSMGEAATEGLGSLLVVSANQHGCRIRGMSCPATAWMLKEIMKSTIYNESRCEFY